MKVKRVPNFQPALGRMVLQARTTLFHQAAEIAADLEDEIIALSRNFFKQMVKMGIDVATPPSFGEYGGSWKALNENYRQWKVSKSRSANFYSNTGDLKKQLLSADTRNVFGDPTANPEAVETGTGYMDRFFRGGRAATAVRSPTTGRFVTESELKRILGFTIRVDAFSELRYGNEDLEETLSRSLGDVSVAYKLTNYRGRRQRPLLTPYMNWWLDKKYRALVRKFGRKRDMV